MSYESPKPLPYLPAGREIFYVPETHRWMMEAKRVRDTQSTDRRHPTGSVIVKNETLIGAGANQASLKHPTLLRWHTHGLCVRRLLHIPSGKHYWLCPGCASHRNHAEAQATNDMRRHGNEGRGATLYLYGHWWACKPCWDTVLAAGITTVYLVEGATEAFDRAK